MFPEDEPLRTSSRASSRGLAAASFSFAQGILRVLLAVALFSSAAQAAWPNDRPIEIMVGYQAGSGPDILARRMALALPRYLAGASFVVTNRPGASGEIALTALSRAEANGYTIGTLTTPSFIIVEHVKTPQYDPAEILPLARVVDDPTLIAAGGASAVNDLTDVVGRLKAAPASLTIGHNGIGTNGHLATLAIERAAGVRLTDVPFKGTSESRTALLGGHVDLVAMSVSEFAMDREAKNLFKALVQFGPTRAKVLPDVPTAHDRGFDIEISTERGFAVRRGVPADVVARLEEAIAAAVTDPEFLRGTTSEEMALAYLPSAGWIASMAARKARYEAIWGAAK
ncbi:MAG: tripartite tricarboxylate transporter substrate binding protein [Bradyrhizobiaceae bacterium]|nr:tripartite tricarboxylate transporter substrate binding protein [Bradyrhizobiaceae bacterium]